MGKPVGPALFLLPFRWPRPVSFFPSWGLGRRRGTWERCRGAALELLTVGGRLEGSPSPPNKCSSREAGTGAMPREAWGAAVGAGVEVADRRWCIRLPNWASLHAPSSGQMILSMANTLPLLSARGREGGCTQDATPGDVPAERKGAHTYCSRPPSPGSGRKEREEVTGAALGATHGPRSLFPAPRGLEIT